MCIRDRFLPYSYTVNSSLYAGVTNSTNLDGSQLININSTFDNIINIGKSKNTLAKVSVRLLATSLVDGDEWKDLSLIHIFINSVLHVPGLKAVVLKTFGSGNAPQKEWFIRQRCV